MNDREWTLLAAQPGSAKLTWKRFALAGVSLIALALVLSATRSGMSVATIGALLQAYTVGYSYDADEGAPNRDLIGSRPDVLIRRQLDALVGRHGPAPLKEDTALVGYDLGQVHTTEWTSGYGFPLAHVEARLRFDDGSEQVEQFKFESGGGSNFLLLWWELSQQVSGWRASPLDHLFAEAAPATPLSDAGAPIQLQPLASVAAGEGTDSESYVDIAVPSDISSNGRLLFDQDVRNKEGSTIYNWMRLRHPDGTMEPLAQTPLSAQGMFSPNGTRVLYVRSRRAGDPLWLVVREVGGTEQEIATVDWMTHHWVDAEHVAYSSEGQIVLHSLVDGSTQRLATLADEMMAISRYFRVAPGGERVAYSDGDNHLWVLDVQSGNTQPIGWDVSERGWGAGMMWDARGERLAYSALNSQTLPDQAEVWLWNARSGHSTLLARAAPGLLNSEHVAFGEVCWAGEETVMFIADRYETGDLKLLAAATDGSGLWDVTPDGLNILYAEVTCARGHVAAPSGRTQLELWKIASIP